MRKAIVILALCVLLAVCGLLPTVCQAEGAAKQAGKQPVTVAELLACLNGAAAKLEDYTVTGTTEANGKMHPFKLTYKRPGLVRIDTSDGQVAVQPNGGIKGRMGHGLLGGICQNMGRNDKRLKDAEGIPFYESDYASIVARIEKQVKDGASAAMKSDHSTYFLEVSSGDTLWKYAVDRGDFSLQENSRWVKGKQAEVTRYTAYHANTGIPIGRFKF